MFSKPIMIAASVAAANATLMAKSATAFSGKSDAVGCGLCLSFNNPPKFVMGGAVADKDNYWNTLATWVTTSLDSDSVKGDICCVDADTVETGSGTPKTFCTKGNVAFDASTKKHTHLVLAANDFYQSALAQCPHN